ncbi:MAG: magnesium/cobalt transporter CorA [Dehalococcoidia bacterium]
MPFRAYYLDSSENLQIDLTEPEVRAAYESEAGLLWVDFSGTNEADGQFLEQTFNFHPVAINDCLRADLNMPNAYDFEGYLFVILHGVNYGTESDVLETTELDMFIGPRFVVTCHRDFMHSMDAAVRVAETNGRPLRQGVDFLAHVIIDAVVNSIMPIIDRLSDRGDDIEEVVFQSLHSTTLEAILQLKRSSLQLRRAMAPQRLVLNQLARGDFGQITPEAAIFYRDVYDSMVRIESSIESLRERTDTIMSTYISAQANQQNEAMRTLSLIAAIFLPLSLVAGIYGMNFEFMPELELKWGYFVVLGTMISVATGVVYWFWARRWITAGRRRLQAFVPAAVDPERLFDYVGLVTRWTRS